MIATTTTEYKHLQTERISQLDNAPVNLAQTNSRMHGAREVRPVSGIWVGGYRALSTQKSGKERMAA
jgi:hypothetical protein